MQGSQVYAGASNFSPDGDDIVPGYENTKWYILYWKIGIRVNR
jgi:hypothetical protein